MVARYEWFSQSYTLNIYTSMCGTVAVIAAAANAASAAAAAVDPYCSYTHMHEFSVLCTFL